MVNTIDTKLAHAVGTARTAVSNLKIASADQSIIDKVLDATIKAYNTKNKATVTLDEFKVMIDSKPTSSGGKITASKEEFRTEIDKRTGNLCFRVAHSTDVEVVNALRELLEYDRTYQAVTGIQDSNRTDWRPLIILSPHPKNPDILAPYRGGWSDGSKQDRNQYSNGRRVPVAKTTGYALEQPLPEAIVKEVVPKIINTDTIEDLQTPLVAEEVKQPDQPQPEHKLTKAERKALKRQGK